MSKPRSRLVGKADYAFRTVKGFTTVIHFGRQAKHLPGQSNYDPSRSTITIGIQQLQHLVELKAGTGTWFTSGCEIVDFDVQIGTYRDRRSGKELPTTRGAIHYSSTGAHVVPAIPNLANMKGRPS